MDNINTLKSIKHFSSLYMKEQAFLVSIITVPIFILLFIVALLSNVLDRDILVAFVPVSTGIVYLSFAYSRTFRFRTMILRQEKAFKTTFCVKGLTPLYPKTLLYSSDLWFVKSGCWAFHKSYLNKIKVRVEDEKSPGRHYVVEFHTTEGRIITDRTLNSGEIRKLKEWHKR